MCVFDPLMEVEALMFFLSLLLRLSDVTFSIVFHIDIYMFGKRFCLYVSLFKCYGFYRFDNLLLVITSRSTHRICYFVTLLLVVCEPPL